MKRLSTVLAAMACIAFATPIFACDQKAKLAGGEKEGGCGKTAQLASAKSGCCKQKMAASVAKVMDHLPRMNYRVGDMTTPCHETAMAKAGCPSKIKYVVNDTVYDTESAATVALAEALEKEAAEMMSIRYAVGDDCFGCPMAASEAAQKSGSKMTYRLAGVDFMTREEAEKVAKLISEAMAKSGDDSAVALASAKPGCDKPCGKSAKLAGDEGDKPCSKPCGKSAKLASDEGDKPNCAKTAAALAAAEAKADDAPPCHKAKAVKMAEAAGETKTDGGCCKKAAERLANVEGKIRTMVETAIASSQSQS